MIKRVMYLMSVFILILDRIVRSKCLFNIFETIFPGMWFIFFASFLIASYMVTTISMADKINMMKRVEDT